MVFLNLDHQEKDAFFALLDEYFTSRPQISASITQSGGKAGNPVAVTAAAASAVQRSISANPEAASKFASSAAATLRQTKSPVGSSADESREEMSSVAGRIAAFSARNREGVNSAVASASRSGPPAYRQNTGAVDSAVKSSLAAVFGSTAKSNATSPVNPPPLAPSVSSSPAKSLYAPPPVRKVASSASILPPAPPPPPPPAAHRQEEPRGEWAEALYDYDSNELGDLNIKENERVLVLERTSDDWWTGEYDGKTGLFPSSYVKML